MNAFPVDVILAPWCFFCFDFFRRLMFSGETDNLRAAMIRRSAFQGFVKQSSQAQGSMTHNTIPQVR
jgi:hypothetical protein